LSCKRESIVKYTCSRQDKNQILIVGYDNIDKKQDSVYSKRIRAGKRRTYFFDVRSTRGNDYYLTITESRKRFDSDGYDRHKIFLYKEDFNKFIKGLNEAIDFVKTDLMPDFDFDAFNHEYPDGEGDYEGQSYEKPAFEKPKDEVSPIESASRSNDQLNINAQIEEVDKW
jgi:hypothetical protein